ncbi:MAG TPA: VOC family protein [Acidimicrobiales bacterium]|nr:VOC family protein [Acidimicrobiales bacterium]
MDLNQVTIGSTDLDRAEAFYRQLGLRLIVKNDTYLRFECPDGASSFSVELAESIPDGDGVILYFEDGDLDALTRRLEDAGVAFEHPPTDMPWLWREARLRDPDGHRLCLFDAGVNRLHPPWRLAADDPSESGASSN